MTASYSLGFLIVSIIISPIMSDSDVVQIASGNNAFANKLYSAISKTEKGNMFFSPISVHTILAMLYQGAGGETANELSAALNVPDKTNTAERYKHAIGQINNLKNVTLHLANKIYIAKGLTLKDSFQKVVKDSFSSEVQSIDFSKSSEAADTINQWVEDNTNSKIRNLVDPATLDSSTLMGLVNAVYFKGNWLIPFPKGDTKTETFYTLDNIGQMNCQMMHLDKVLYFRPDGDLNANVLKLYYINQNVFMVLILPNERDGIVELERKLVNVDLSTITKNMLYGYSVEVSLPKFRIETKMDLEPILKEVGLGSIFSPTVDFSGITGESLFVGEATQKAYIEVNEEGTEAAAATSTWMFLSGPFEFKADHPFVILLQAEYDGVINTLFYGKVMKPIH